MAVVVIGPVGAVVAMGLLVVPVPQPLAYVVCVVGSARPMVTFPMERATSAQNGISPSLRMAKSSAGTSGQVAIPGKPAQ